MKKVFFTIIILKSLVFFGQNYNKITPSTIKLDSIDVKFFYNQEVDGIEVESYFKKSKSKLRTIYYLDEKTYYLIVVQEKSKKSDDTWRTNVFQFEDGKMFYEKESYYSKINGVAIEHSKDNTEVYNKELDSRFLKKYIIEIFDKIRNHH